MLATMANKEPAWKLLGATYGNRAGTLLAEMATHAAGMQAALDALSDLLDLPPNHALSSRQVVMLVKEEVAKAALGEIVGPELQPLPDRVESAQAQIVLEWVRARCSVLVGTVGGSTATELHTAFQDDDGLLGVIQFSKALKAIGPPLRLSEIWGINGRGTCRRQWNLAVTAPAPRKRTPEPPPARDWVDGGPWSFSS